jgi:recombinational DNA repair protein (RecF pathway)
VDALAAGAPVDPLARYFEYWLLRLQGLYPSASTCPLCHAPLDDDGSGGAHLAWGERTFTCRRCVASGPRRGNELSREALSFLSQAAKVSPERVGDLPFSPRAARELAAVHRALIATHLEKELKSVRVLREMGE